MFTCFFIKFYDIIFLKEWFFMLSRAKSKKSIKNLKRFKSAKFNYAKFVKNYYIDI